MKAGRNNSPKPHSLAPFLAEVLAAQFATLTQDKAVQKSEIHRTWVSILLTKQFEEFRVGLPPELLVHYSAKSVKGEIVFLVSPRERERRAIDE